MASIKPYMTPEEKAEIIWKNGYIDMRTITGEIADDRVQLLNELSERICELNSEATITDIIEIILNLRKENTR